MTRAEYPAVAGVWVMVQCVDTGVVPWPLTLPRLRLETLTTDICFYSELLLAADKKLHFLSSITSAEAGPGDRLHVK